jgi:outer membrane receptor protein involved in Fe transport
MQRFRVAAVGGRPVASNPAWRVAVAVALAVGGAVQPALAAEGDAGEAMTELEEVQVTGSRIVRRDLEAASPIVTVEAQVFEESSTLAVESVLNQLPQFVPANTQFNTANVFPDATSTPGISTVNMRGLGSNRTLVLVDGRRAQPANSTLVIDTNSIPSSALESVEIISGGASAVYGADALGGVTNFKLKSNFQGIDLQFRTGITEEGDGEENRVSLLLGTGIGRSGNAMLGLEWSERGEVLAIDRPFYRNAIHDPRTNTGSNARMNGFSFETVTTGMLTADIAALQAAANALFPNRPAYMTNVPLGNSPSGFMINRDGTLYRVEGGGIGAVPSNGTDSLSYRITPQGTLAQANTDLRYSSPLTRYSLFGKAHFPFNDYIEAYSQVNFVNTINRQVLQPTGAVGGFAASIPHGDQIYGPSLADDGVTTRPEYVAGGAYGLNCPPTGGCTRSQAFPVSPQLASLLDARGTNRYANQLPAGSRPQREFDPVTGQEIPVRGAGSNWALGGTFDFLPPRTIENTTNLYQVLAGLRGTLPFGDWTWDGYASHGATRIDLDYIGWVSTQRWRALASAPNFGRGASIAGPASTSLNCTSGLPIFGDFEISQDCIDALRGNYTDRTRLTQDVIEATAQGRIVDLPAGELRAAVGVTRRDNKFQYMPDATRDRSNIIDSVVGSFGQANVIGKTRVEEVYGELLVPLLRDLPGVKNLELELGYRYSDYGTAGDVPTWKALFSYSPVNWLRFRGGYQLANRAPNINELFLDASSTAVTLNTPDPCRADTTATWGNHPSNPNRAAVQALCEAIIGNTTSDFSADPNNFLGGRGDGVQLQITSGNRNLRSEEGRTWTLGAVIRSPFTHPLLSGGTLSVDWYKVKITDAVTQVSAQTTYDLCFNRSGTSNPTYSFNDPNGVCQNIVRDEVSGAASFVRSTYANTGTQRTSGIDAALYWRAAMADMGLPSLPGSVSLNVSYTKLFEFEAQEFAGGATVDYAGTFNRGGLFDWRTVTTLRYANSGWDVALNWRHLPPIKHANYATDPTTVVQGSGAYDIFGLVGNVNVNSRLAVGIGIDNLFDRQPERYGAGQVVNVSAVNGGGTVILNGNGSTQPAVYDVLGRRYFMNVKLRF